MGGAHHRSRVPTSTWPLSRLILEAVESLARLLCPSVALAVCLSHGVTLQRRPAPLNRDTAISPLDRSRSSVIVAFPTGSSIHVASGADSADSADSAEPCSSCSAAEVSRNRCQRCRGSRPSGLPSASGCGRRRTVDLDPQAGALCDGGCCLSCPSPRLLNTRTTVSVASRSASSAVWSAVRAQIGIGVFMTGCQGMAYDENVIYPSSLTDGPTVASFRRPFTAAALPSRASWWDHGLTRRLS